MPSLIRRVFGADRVVLPVIHPVDYATALESTEVAYEAGVRGVFLINQGMQIPPLLFLVAKIRRRHPALWVGVNLLGLSPQVALENALAACGSLDGLWSDNAKIDERCPASQQVDAARFLTARRELGWEGLYFGGVAFKYQREVAPEDAGRAAEIAMTYVDVVCTSGPGTGQPADVDKVAMMRAATGPDAAIALASGVTAENLECYLPYVDAFLVGTSIEAAPGVLCSRKLSLLLARCPGSYS